MPLQSGDAVPKLCTKSTIEYIQHIIKMTSTPSWIYSVPYNYGEANAGSIKADEWRILSTIYLPIALVTLWGDRNITARDLNATPSEQYFLKVLDNSMALFQAVTLVVRYTMAQVRAKQFRHHLKDWVEGLQSLYPHVKDHARRPNVHAAFHIYDFLLLFGPVTSWWCFPFERLIGALQKINTNDLVSGKSYSSL